MKRILFLTLLCATTFTSAQAQRLVPPAGIPNAPQSHAIQVQSNDSYKVNELEETVRKLNGKVEELNFLLLQLQEKFRKMEEDNESRFQEIEEKQSSLTDKSKDVATADTGSTKDVATADTGGDNSLEKPETSGDAKATPDDNNSEAIKDVKTALNTRPTAPKDLSPRALGTLTFDKDGNVVDGGSDGKTAVILNPFKSGTLGSVEASEFGATPAEVFSTAKQALNARQYPRAQQAFAAHLKAWPKDPRVGETRYYLGQSLFWQKSYYKAAEIYLETHNEYPEAPTAADNLLALGLSLAGLNQREVACATYAEVLKQYPDDAKRLGEKVKDEQAAAKC
ncbi:MAG: tol-pal system protein YbgF [Rhizobiaceae bacterium]